MTTEIAVFWDVSIRLYWRFWEKTGNVYQTTQRQIVEYSGHHSYLHGNLTYLRNDELVISVALVRERTIPTERQPLVGEVSANFCG
jgi:hypothetical protein